MRHLSNVLMAICLAVAALAACAPSSARNTAEAPSTDADVDAINATYEMLLAAQKESDVENWLALFSEDVVFMPPSSTNVEGKEAVRAVVQPFMEQFMVEDSISFDEIEVPGDWAFARGTRLFKSTPKAGGDTLEQNIKFIHILRRQSDGTWKYTRWIWNSNTPEE